LTIFGWDASHYDWGRGSMDIGAAVRAGISFLTHKATEGTTYTDAQFATAMSRAHGVVPVAGAYHVLHTGNINAQVDHYLSVLSGQSPWWQSGNFLVQLDCERWATDFPQKADIKAWCDRFVSVTGGTHRPIVYASRGQYGSTLSGLGYPLWNAAYPSGNAGSFKSLYPGDTSSNWAAYSGATPAIWQYTSNATIGSQTECDANAYRGTLVQLQALLRGPSREDDMEQSESVQYWNNAGRVGTRVGWVLGDLENLRDYWLSEVGQSIVKPTPGSPLGLLESFLQSTAAAAAAPTDAQVNAAVLAALQNPDVQQGIADKLGAQLNGTRPA
jgi:GH25 family lysozyme M1 (1,4-beta-N-acetylmuramidase)